jgi:hypothetical protein
MEGTRAVQISVLHQLAHRYISNPLRFLDPQYTSQLTVSSGFTGLRLFLVTDAPN